MKYVIFLFLSALAVLVSSCIHGEEEIFVESDGSARLKAVYRVPTLLFSAEDAEKLTASIEEGIGQKEYLKLVTNQVVTVEGSRVLTLEIETKDLTELKGLSVEKAPGDDRDKADSLLDAIVGHVDVQLEGLSVALQRDVDLATVLSKHLGSNGAAMLGDSQFSYTIHLPKAAEKTDAHQVENGGRTLKWVFKLSESHKRPISMNLSAPLPIPWWVYAVVAAVVCVLVLCLWLALRMVKRRVGFGAKKDTRIASSDRNTNQA